MVNKERVLLTGSQGLVGSRLVELMGDSHELITPSHQEFNLNDLESLRRFLAEVRPDVVVNLAAFTDVSGAESDPDKARRCLETNADGTQNLVEALADTNVHLVHISTDMVFSGRSGPYHESDQTETDPTKLTVYGLSKAQAEAFIPTDGAIIRIIYPVRAAFAKKLDYLRLPLALFKQSKLYPLFSDQIVSFTYIDELAKAISVLAAEKTGGIYHVSSDTFSPYDLVCYLLQHLNYSTDSVKMASIEQYLASQKNPYRYPIRGGLATDSTSARLNIEFRTWTEVVDALIAQGLS